MLHPRRRFWGLTLWGGIQRKMASPGESGAQRKSLAAPVQNAPELDPARVDFRAASM